MMNRTVIIGYGNPLRGDDGLGWFAARRLEEIFPHENVHIITCHQLTPELAEDISRADLVLFIDASIEGLPGSFNVLALEAGDDDLISLTHDFTPTSLLTLSKFLYGKTPEAYVLSITGECFDFVEELSPICLSSCSKLVTWAQNKIRHIDCS